MTDLQAVQLAMTDAVSRNGRRTKDGGTCHITALETMCYSKARSARLVQGLAKYGTFHCAHSWIVVCDKVVDLDGTYSTSEWDLKREPTNCFVYTPKEAMEMALKHQHYGPWEDELCNHDRMLKRMAGAL